MDQDSLTESGLELIARRLIEPFFMFISVVKTQYNALGYETQEGSHTMNTTAQDHVRNIAIEYVHYTVDTASPIITVEVPEHARPS